MIYYIITVCNFIFLLHCKKCNKKNKRIIIYLCVVLYLLNFYLLNFALLAKKKLKTIINIHSHIIIHKILYNQKNLREDY